MTVLASFTLPDIVSSAVQQTTGPRRAVAVRSSAVQCATPDTHLRLFCAHWPMTETSCTLPAAAVVRVQEHLKKLRTPRHS